MHGIFYARMWDMSTSLHNRVPCCSTTQKARYSCVTMATHVTARHVLVTLLVHGVLHHIRYEAQAVISIHTPQLAEDWGWSTSSSAELRKRKSGNTINFTKFLLYHMEKIDSTFVHLCILLLCYLTLSTMSGKAISAIILQCLLMAIILVKQNDCRCIFSMKPKYVLGLYVLTVFGSLYKGKESCSGRKTIIVYIGHVPHAYIADLSAS